jgi:hypothetical protein
MHTHTRVLHTHTHIHARAGIVESTAAFLTSFTNTTLASELPIQAGPPVYGDPTATFSDFIAPGSVQ